MKKTILIIDEKKFQKLKKKYMRGRYANESNSLFVRQLIEVELSRDAKRRMNT